ncbi:MAG TPA: endo-1,4-beta-xylanase, partial [Pseudonocardiaceae bacterium]
MRAAQNGLWSLLTVVALSLTGATASAAPALQPASHARMIPLRHLAERDDRYFGASLNVDLLGTSAPYTAVAKTQFDMDTPENAMKWDTVEPSNGTFDFGPGDQVVAFAEQNHARVRGHNLVWHSQLPSWVTALPMNQVQAAMESHITAEAAHYRGKIYAWDVVNEPFNDDGTLRADVFETAMGPGYLADALRTAHAADPKARLYLNDFNIEGVNAKSDAMYDLVKTLKAQGVPIGGVGLESHFVLGQVPATMRANMARFARLGVDVAVTELDVRMVLPATAADLAQQAADYATVVDNCLAVSRCVGVTQWDVSDADSWISGFFTGQGAATMYDENYLPKPAYT